jgi:hypothetical protein
MRKIVDTILPTTMVGSYPRPAWFTYQLAGRDARVAFKHVDHEAAYADATRVIIQDQEESRSAPGRSTSPGTSTSSTTRTRASCPMPSRRCSTPR